MSLCTFPIYSKNMDTLRDEARANLKAGGLKVDNKSIMQNIFKMIESLKMNNIYESALGDNSHAVSSGESYGLKNVGEFLKLDSELSKLIMEKDRAESSAERKRDIEEELKLKREQLDLATKEVEVKEELAVGENKSAENKQQQVTVQQQIVEAKQDEVEVEEKVNKVVEKTQGEKADDSRRKK